MALSPTEIQRGNIIVYQDVPHLVVDVMHRTQGRQAGFVQVTLRNLKSGSSTNTKLRSTNSVELLHTTKRILDYSYSDVSGLHFLDPDTFEDVVLSEALLADQKLFLVENKPYNILFIDDEPIRVDLPSSIEMYVTEAPEGLKGDTANNPKKTVKLQTGLEIQAPLFVKTGDKVKVSTEDGSYQGRV